MSNRRIVHRLRLVSQRLLVPIILVASAVLSAGEAAPDQGGAYTVVHASLYGGPGVERFSDVLVLPDRSIVAAGTCAGAFPIPGLRGSLPAQATGFVIVWDAQGKPTAVTWLQAVPIAIAMAPRERLLVRDATGAVLVLAANLSRQIGRIEPGSGPGLAVADDGDIVLIADGQLRRLGPDGNQRWSVVPPAHGHNHPLACAVDPISGTAVVTGYGMTHTGHEPYKDPYAHGYDRTGKRLWTLWNHPPQEQRSADLGGTGLMADGTADGVTATSDGHFLVRVYHDGGNAVAARDPSDARKPMDPAVFAGSFQAGPGHGMKGAITTSACFRVDAVSGRIEKGTWMTAWMDGGKRANSLSMHDAAADGGVIGIVGASAWELRTQQPWYAFREGEYRGGPFLAIFDASFAMVQCGGWGPGEIVAVAAGQGLVAIAGSAAGVEGKESKPIPPDAQVRLHQPVGQSAVLGQADALLVVLQQRGSAIPIAPHRPVNGPKVRPTDVTSSGDGSGAPAKAVPVIPTQPTSLPAWDALLLRRLAAGIDAGHRFAFAMPSGDVEIESIDGEEMVLRQGAGLLPWPARKLDFAQRRALAGLIIRLATSEDYLLLAYYLRRAGDERQSAIWLAKAGRTAADLDRAEPPAR